VSHEFPEAGFRGDRRPRQISQRRRRGCRHVDPRPAGVAVLPHRHEREHGHARDHHPAERHGPRVHIVCQGDLTSSLLMM